MEKIKVKREVMVYLEKLLATRTDCENGLKTSSTPDHHLESAVPLENLPTRRISRPVDRYQSCEKIRQKSVDYCNRVESKVKCKKLFPSNCTMKLRSNRSLNESQSTGNDNNTPEKSKPENFATRKSEIVQSATNNDETPSNKKSLKRSAQSATIDEDINNNNEEQQKNENVSKKTKIVESEKNCHLKQEIFDSSSDDSNSSDLGIECELINLIPETPDSNPILIELDGISRDASGSQNSVVNRNSQTSTTTEPECLSNPLLTSRFVTNPIALERAQEAQRDLVIIVTPVVQSQTKENLTKAVNDAVRLFQEVSKNTVILRQMYRNRPLGIFIPDAEQQILLLKKCLQNLANFLQISTQVQTLFAILSIYSNLNGDPVLNVEELDFIMKHQSTPRSSEPSFIQILSDSQSGVGSTLDSTTLNSNENVGNTEPNNRAEPAIDEQTSDDLHNLYLDFLYDLDDQRVEQIVSEEIAFPRVQESETQIEEATVSMGSKNAQESQEETTIFDKTKESNLNAELNLMETSNQNESLEAVEDVDREATRQIENENNSNVISNSPGVTNSIPAMENFSEALQDSTPTVEIADQVPVNAATFPISAGQFCNLTYNQSDVVNILQTMPPVMFPDTTIGMPFMIPISIIFTDSPELQIPAPYLMPSCISLDHQPEMSVISDQPPSTDLSNPEMETLSIVEVANPLPVIPTVEQPVATPSVLSRSISAPSLLISSPPVSTTAITTSSDLPNTQVPKVSKQIPVTDLTNFCPTLSEETSISMTDSRKNPLPVIPEVSNTVPSSVTIADPSGVNESSSVTPEVAPGISSPVTPTVHQPEPCTTDSQNPSSGGNILRTHPMDTKPTRTAGPLKNPKSRVVLIKIPSPMTYTLFPVKVPAHSKITNNTQTNTVTNLSNSPAVPQKRQSSVTTFVFFDARAAAPGKNPKRPATLRKYSLPIMTYDDLEKNPSAMPAGTSLSNVPSTKSSIQIKAINSAGNTTLWTTPDNSGTNSNYKNESSSNKKSSVEPKAIFLSKEDEIIKLILSPGSKRIKLSNERKLALDRLIEEKEKQKIFRLGLKSKVVRKRKSSKKVSAPVNVSTETFVQTNAEEGGKKNAQAGVKIESLAQDDRNFTILNPKIIYINKLKSRIQKF